MLDATKRVLELYDNDEFELFIIQGKNGYGKTTYANRIIAEVYSHRNQNRWGGNGHTGNWNVNLFKNHLGFHPMKVLNRWTSMKKRDYVYHWDDAGVWLNAYDYQDPFVKEAAKYLQTARTDWACLIFSCIDKDDVIKKLRDFRSAVIIDVTKKGCKTSTGKPSDINRRTANAWHYWKDRLGKLGTENDWEETFDSHVPDKFYEWYKPNRDRYARLNKRLMKQKARAKKDIRTTTRFSKV